MRRSRNETVESRRRIVKAASHLFRERGVAQVSVADVMNAADMTHGGFYVHFTDKDALIAEATTEAFSEKLDEFDSDDKTKRQRTLRNYIDGYLTLDHVLMLGSGCPIAGLAQDTAHGAVATKTAMSQGAEQTIEAFAQDLPKLRGTARENAISTLTSIVGAIVVARALKNKKLQKEVIETVRRSDVLKSVLGPKST